MKLQDTIDKVNSRLKALEDRQFDQLSFDWEGIRFHAVSEGRADGSAQIRISADLGRLYFTVENASHRAVAIERLYANNRAIDGAYSVDNNGNVLFQCLTKTPHKMLGNDLLVALTTIILQTETHLLTLKSHLKPTQLAA